MRSRCRVDFEAKPSWASLALHWRQNTGCPPRKVFIFYFSNTIVPPCRHFRDPAATITIAATRTAGPRTHCTDMSTLPGHVVESVFGSAMHKKDKLPLNDSHPRMLLSR